jgi:hypothetical protein
VGILRGAVLRKKEKKGNIYDEHIFGPIAG